MSFRFPEFSDPQQLDGQRTWTAVFDSYDQRNDELYYVVDIHDGEEAPTRIMAQVWPGLPDDQWTEPVFAETVRADIARVAATGRSNTPYTGPMVPGSGRPE